MRLLNKYKNGNYFVKIYDNGTKIRYNNLENHIPTFAESIDLKITNKCDINCPMCHEKSTIDGQHGDILDFEFLNSLHPGTEIAIGGGNALSHPDLIAFLKQLKIRNIIPNITINQNHITPYQTLINYLFTNNLIYGLGVSVSVSNPNIELLQTLSKYPNVVIHVIEGLLTPDVYNQIKKQNLKILILGYKIKGRGETYYKDIKDTILSNSNFLQEKLESRQIFSDFNTVSFDNLAIKRLNIKKILSPEEYEIFYNGDDGKFTFYIDKVNNQFAKSSTTKERFIFTSNIDEMFQQILNSKGAY